MPLHRRTRAAGSRRAAWMDEGGQDKTGVWYIGRGGPYRTNAPARPAAYAHTEIAHAYRPTRHASPRPRARPHSAARGPLRPGSAEPGRAVELPLRLGLIAPGARRGLGGCGRAPA